MSPTAPYVGSEGWSRYLQGVFIRVPRGSRRSSKALSSARWGSGLALSLALTSAACEPDPGDAGWKVALEAGTDEGALLSVWGASADDVWAVGGQPGALDAGGAHFVVHFDGDGWEKATLPDAIAGEVPLLNWVFGVDGVLVAVGEGGVVLRSAAGDGSDWTIEDTPTDLPLWGVWGAGADDLWAVGGDATPNSGDPVLLHYDGSAWIAVDVPALDRNCDALFKVWGAGGRVFVVGDAGVILGRDPNDGAWSQVPSGTTADLISLWGTGPDDMVAVGGRANGTVLRFDGDVWTGGSVPGVPGLNGVWVDGAGVAHIVGIQGFAGRLSPDDEVTVDDSSAGPLVLHAIFGFNEKSKDGNGGAQSRFAVGGTLDRTPPLEGILIQSLR